MKKLVCLLICLFVTACAKDFFGVKRTSDYFSHLQKKVNCAFVEGWSANTAKCYCTTVGPSFPTNNDRIFFEAEDWACVTNNDYPPKGT
jgi:hypothetical protein